MIFAISPEKLERLSRERLVRLAHGLTRRLQRVELRMLTKKEVAIRVGMTVSWLDNSQSELAIAIRKSGIRYGSSRTSPVRYPLVRLIEIMERL